MTHKKLGLIVPIVEKSLFVLGVETAWFFSTRSANLLSVTVQFLVLIFKLYLHLLDVLSSKGVAKWQIARSTDDKTRESGVQCLAAHKG